jgi:hypothetical protein
MLLAGIGKLPDTVADRSVIIEMVRKRRDEKVKRLRARDGDDMQDLGRKLARWTADNLDVLRQADPKVPEALNDRAADAWSPLFAIADMAGGWSERPRRAAVELSGRRKRIDAGEAARRHTRCVRGARSGPHDERGPSGASRRARRAPVGRIREENR